MRTMMLVSAVAVVLAAAGLVSGKPQYGPVGEEDFTQQQQQVPHAGAAGHQGEKYWWQADGVFENTGNHPATQHSANINAFTPQQSQHCSVGNDCVPWSTCIDGYIDTSGASTGLDLRKPGTAPPKHLGYTICGAIGNVCCQITGYVHVEGSASGIIGGGGHSGATVHTDGHDHVGVVVQTGADGHTHVNGGPSNIDGHVHVGGGPSNIDGHSHVDGGHAHVGGGPSNSDGHVHVAGGPSNIDGHVHVDGIGQVSSGLHIGVNGGEPGRTGGDYDYDGTSGGYDGVGGAIGGGIVSVGGVGSGGIGTDYDGGAQVGVGNIGGGGIVGVGGVVGGVGDIHNAGVGSAFDGGFQDYSSSGGFCSPNEVCVHNNQCINGNLNTGGVGLIDLRTKFPSLKLNYRICPTDQGDAGVCCRDTGKSPVVAVCPDYGICTDYSYCDAHGFIVPDPYTSLSYNTGIDCFTNAGVSLNVGVCCQPKPSPTTPPPPAYVTCPHGSECIPEDFCFGELYNEQLSWAPYSPTGSWSKCFISNEAGHGACCKNLVPELPNSCGVSHYANSGDNFKTRFYPQHLTKLEADFGEFPWQAIVFHANYTFKCGASLITDRHLLTVGHCVYGLFSYDIRIRLGEWQVNTFSEPLPYQDFEVNAITVHPDFNPVTNTNSLAIIELKNPAILQYNINNVCLPFAGTHTDVSSYSKCWVSGWGKDSFVGKYQHVLKKIDVPLIDHHQCQSLLRYTRLGKYFVLDPSFRCAGGELGKDACVGDGGGPLICYDEGTKAYVQVGITAWGIGCGQKDVPGVYTDIYKFTPWISSVTQFNTGGGAGNYGK